MGEGTTASCGIFEMASANCIKSLGDVARERTDHDDARARYDQALSACTNVRVRPTPRQIAW